MSFFTLLTVTNSLTTKTGETTPNNTRPMSREEAIALPICGLVMVLVVVVICLL